MKRLNILLQVLLTMVFATWPHTRTEAQISCAQMSETCTQAKQLVSSGRLDESVQVLRHAVVKGMSLCDSCPDVPYMMSLMAQVLTMQGDTILPTLLHDKAQYLTVRWLSRSNNPDTIATRMRNYNLLLQQVQNAKLHFTRNKPTYLETLGAKVSLMNQGNNPLEAIYIGDELLRLAKDSCIVDTANQVFDCYIDLLEAFAWEKQMERVEQLLPKAVQYYTHFYPDQPYLPSLYGCIGIALYYTSDYAVSLGYLQKSIEAGTTGDKAYDDQLKEHLSLCKKHINK